MFVLQDVQLVTLSVAFVDAAGNPTTVLNPPTWAVSDATILGIVPAADGLSAVVTALGPLGTAQVSLQADGALVAGAAPEPIIGTFDVQVVASDAVTAQISAGTPAHK